MKVIVNGQVAALEASATFEYKQENPLFTNAEGYSMELTFPMKDQPNNILIFGPLHVKGVDISKVTFPCEMVCDAFDKTGVLTIIEVSDVYVKGQFLEGMSAENFQTSADLLTYLTDLDFSQWDGQTDNFGNFPLAYYTSEYDAEWGITTWKKDLTKSGPEAGWDQVVIYNKSTGTTMGHLTYEHIQRHIYLAHLVDLVGKTIGWSVDQQVLSVIPFYKYILVANRREFPKEDYHSWTVRPLCDSLPRWTVREFFQNIADYFGCIVEYNSVTKTIVFKSYRQIMDDTSGNIPEINLSVCDEFSVELSDESNNKYKGSQSFKLPDESNPGNINSCQWALRSPRFSVLISTEHELIERIQKGALESWKEHPDLHGLGIDDFCLWHLNDLNKYVVVTKTEKYWIDGEPSEGSYQDPDYVFQCIEVLNQYGAFSEGTELKVCNCPFETVEYFKSDDPTSTSGSGSKVWEHLPVLELPDDPLDVYMPSQSTETPASEILSGGEPKKEDMYFDKLWIFLMKNSSQSAYGSAYTRALEPRNAGTLMYEPVPGSHLKRVITDEEGNPIMFPHTDSIDRYPYTLSPYSGEIKTYRKIPAVDESILYRYKFIASSLPPATSIFIIKGHKYVCRCLTAQFSNDGMSELIEGEFYEIVG